jgi:hypothetical protein
VALEEIDDGAWLACEVGAGDKSLGTRPRLENRARPGARHRCRERAILYLWSVAFLLRLRNRIPEGWDPIFLFQSLPILAIFMDSRHERQRALRA